MSATGRGRRGLPRGGTPRGRAIVTVLGVAWGTFSIVALLSFSAGLEGVMRKRSQGMGQGIIILWPGATARPWQGVPEGRPIQLEVDDAWAILAEVPAIRSVSPEQTRREVVARGEFVFRARIAGVTPSYGALRNMLPAPGGRFLSERDERESRTVAFLGDRIATELFPGGDAVGQTIVLANAPFLVVGVLQPKEQDSDYNGSDDQRVCVPLSTYRRRFGTRFLDDMVLTAVSPDRAAEAVEAATKVLARRHSFDPDDESALQWWDTTEGDRIRSYAFLAMDVLTGGASVMTLLVGGIGIANLMFILVRQRTAEIGLFLALGARRRAVLLGVMGEAIGLTALGGVIGLGAALGLGHLVAASSLVETFGVPYVTPVVGLGTAALLVMVGVAAGWFPARRAAGLDPVRALAAR